MESTTKKLEIWRDQDAINNREYSRFSTFVFSHGRYDLGDVAFTKAGTSGSLFGDFVLQLLEVNLKISDVIYYPVSMYEHGNVRMFIGEVKDFDTGHLGYVYATKSDVRSDFGRITDKVKAKVASFFESELEDYTNYINGDIFGFTTTINGEVTEAVGGFNGSDPLTNGMMGQLNEDFKVIATNNEFSTSYN